MRTHVTDSARVIARLAPQRRAELQRKYLELAASFTSDAVVWRGEGDTRFAEELDAVADDYRRAAEVLA